MDRILVLYSVIVSVLCVENTDNNFLPIYSGENNNIIHFPLFIKIEPGTKISSIIQNWTMHKAVGDVFCCCPSFEEKLKLNDLMFIVTDTNITNCTQPDFLYILSSAKCRCYVKDLKSDETSAASSLYNNRTDTISNQVYIYVGGIAVILLTVQVICIITIKKRNTALSIDKYTRLQSSKIQKNPISVEGKSYKGNSHPRSVSDVAHDRYGTNPKIRHEDVSVKERETSHIYYSLDNLHIATQEPISSYLDDKHRHWRISKREPIEPASLTRTLSDNRKLPQKLRPPAPIQCIDNGSADRLINKRVPYPLPHNTLCENNSLKSEFSKEINSIPLQLVRRPPPPPTSLPKTNNSLVNQELNNIFKKRRINEKDNNLQLNQPNSSMMAESFTTGMSPVQVDIPKRSPKKTSQQLVLPRKPKLDPVCLPAKPLKPRLPTPKCAQAPSQASTYSEDDDDWTYEDLPNVSIYNV